MEITEIRRARLRLWFADQTLPKKEKSYLSQLMGGSAPFGERAARRLERDYGMGDKYLDHESSAHRPQPTPLHGKTMSDVQWVLEHAAEKEISLLVAMIDAIKNANKAKIKHKKA